MTLTIIFTILLIHWIADFVLQDEKWAIGKSKNWGDLLSHTFFYSYVWTLAILFFVDYSYEHNIIRAIEFGTITFIFHTITDYFTSRIVSRKFERKEYGTSIPNTGAFTIIGFDQLLHYLQLFLTYQYLILQ